MGRKINGLGALISAALCQNVPVWVLTHASASHLSPSDSWPHERGPSAMHARGITDAVLSCATPCVGFNQASL